MPRPARRLKKSGGDVEHRAVMPCAEVPSFFQRLGEVGDTDVPAHCNS
jgi:hypothetical protein